MMHNMAMQEVEEVKTLVWWSINSCPIPNGYDPRQVGPSIVSALKNSKVSGPVTIAAIGKLITQDPNTALDDDVLRDLSSSGVALIHVNEVQSNLFEWVRRNPPPANIMLISSLMELESLARTLYSLDEEGYTVFLAYSHRDPASDWLWKSFLSGVYKEWLWTSLLTADMDSGLSADNKQLTTTRLVLPSKFGEIGGEAPWFCSFCFFAAQSFEDFTTHLKSEEHRNNDPDLVKMVDLVEMVDVVKPTQAPKQNPIMVDMVKRNQLKEQEANEEVKTLVWWNINTCPIPPGYDPRQVGPRIVSALKNSKVSGPVTVAAIGKLITRDPTTALNDDVLRDLSSSGVALIHANEVQSCLFDWMRRNPPPANILLMSGPTELENLAHTIYGLDSEGYTVFLAYSQRRPASDWLWKSFFSGVHKEWLWTSLLTANMDSGSAVCQQLTTRLVHPSNNCSEAGGESPWFCSFCFFAAQSFEDFTTHLKSEEHRNNDPDLVGCDEA